MDVIILLIVFVGTFIAGMATNMTASEVYDRCPSIARWLIRFAARKLPRAFRDRREEEWLSHAADCPGKVGQIVHAVGCVWASRNLHRRTKTRSGHSKNLVAGGGLTMLGTRWVMRPPFWRAYIDVAALVVTGVVFRRELRTREARSEHRAHVRSVNAQLERGLDRYRCARILVRKNRRRFFQISRG
jgi:hypothetical protein